MSKESVFPIGLGLKNLSDENGLGFISELRDFSLLMQRQDQLNKHLIRMSSDSSGTILEGGHCAYSSLYALFGEYISISQVEEVAKEEVFFEIMNQLAKNNDWDIKKPSTSSEFLNLMSSEAAKGAILQHSKVPTKVVSFSQNPEYFTDEFILDTPLPYSSHEKLDKLIEIGHMAAIVPISGKIIEGFENEKGYVLFDVSVQNGGNIPILNIDHLIDIYFDSYLESGSRNIFIMLEQF